MGERLAVARLLASFAVVISVATVLFAEWMIAFVPPVAIPAIGALAFGVGVASLRMGSRVLGAVACVAALTPVLLFVGAVSN